MTDPWPPVVPNAEAAGGGRGGGETETLELGEVGGPGRRSGAGDC